MLMLLETSWDGVSIHDAEGRVTFANRALADLLGDHPSALVGRDPCDFVHPDDSPGFRNAVEAASREQTFLRYRVKTAAADWQFVDARAVNCRDDPLIGGVVVRIRFDAVNDGPACRRVAELEQHLHRIAHEVNKAGVVHAMEGLPTDTESRHAGELSVRQREVLARLMRGERVVTIAREMYISASTVRNHLATIFRKFEVHSQAELIDLLRSREESQ
jgi:DNA-binding CsgD family transcriptional regulator